jgi:uncharacterized protein (DUF433 family)
MKYIERNQDIFGGEPVVVGTRIPAVRLTALIRQGYTETSLRSEFPQVSLQKLRGALAELMEAGIMSLEKTYR